MLFAQGENWIYRYSSSLNYWDQANSIAYGTDGNIYAAGFSSGHDTYLDFLVISLSSAGDTNWVYCYNGPWNFADRANSVIYGADGNIYAAGASTGHGPDRDFTVISLTTTGDTNWVYKYNGPGNNWDEAYSIVYGNDNNIYAAGYSNSSGIDADFTVISFTNTGDTNWIYTYNGSGNYGDFAYSIVYGSDGNIYAAGYSGTSDSSSDFTVISLTSAGTANWVYRYHGSGNLSDKANSIVYGADGNIYAAGISYDSDASSDFTVISLTPAGIANWIYRYRMGHSENTAYSIVYGTDGNIYAAGTTVGNGTGQDFIIINLTTAGDTNWVYLYNGPGNSDDYSYSLVYGADDNIYAAGSSMGNGTSNDFTVISLTTAGETNWVYRYYGLVGDYGDFATSIVYGADSNIYIAGQSTGSGTGQDFIVISLSPDYGVKEENTIIRKNIYNATILCCPLILPYDIKCKVFDITGRMVMPDKIKPGVYFIQIDNKIIQKVVKVK
jgi:uncharacterized delta-60 repeat protein